jgi:dihydrofolate reductase (trimethoprim resistance protein)
VTIALVAAQSLNQVIGNGPEIPWRVKGEQALFKKITMGGTLIMGRKTFESIGRPLPGRTTIIVTRNPDYTADDCLVTRSLDEALAEAGKLERPVYIAGGGEIYRQAIQRADALHLTTIHTEVEGDVLFPDLPADFKLVSEELHASNIDYTYRYYERS